MDSSLGSVWDDRAGGASSGFASGPWNERLILMAVPKAGKRVGLRIGLPRLLVDAPRSSLDSSQTYPEKSRLQAATDLESRPGFRYKFGPFYPVCSELLVRVIHATRRSIGEEAVDVLAFTLAAILSLGISSATWADDAEGEYDDPQFPYRAFVNGDDVYVRSGPGQNYYPVLRLKRGETVDVFRHDPGGWYAIRPPAEML